MAVIKVLSQMPSDPVKTIKVVKTVKTDKAVKALPLVKTDKTVPLSSVKVVKKDKSDKAVKTVKALPLAPAKTIDKQKNKYKKIGQTKDTPLPNEPLTRFYTSLLKQTPGSRMALKWCLERGLLGDKAANEAVLVLEMEKKCKMG